jgi:hypothetical protein
MGQTCRKVNLEYFLKNKYIARKSKRSYIWEGVRVGERERQCTIKLETYNHIPDCLEKIWKHAIPPSQAFNSDQPMANHPCWQEKGSFSVPKKVHAKKVPTKIKKWPAFVNLAKKKNE